MVDASTLVRRGAPITLGLLSFFSFIVAVIASVLTHDYNANERAKHDPTSVRSRVRFFVFVGWFSFVFATAYVICFLAGIGGIFTSIVSHLIFLGLNSIFYLSAAASLTASVNNGCPHKYKYCSADKALVAFGWINWILCLIMLCVVSIIGAGAFRGGGMKETFGSH